MVTRSQTASSEGPTLLIPLSHLTDTSCPLCDSDIETLDHLLVSCPVSDKMWSLSKCNLRIRNLGRLTFHKWLDLLCKPPKSLVPSEFELEFLTFGALVMMSLWKLRNEVIKGNGLVVWNELDLVRIDEKNAIDHCVAQRETSMSCKPPSRPSTWELPPHGWVKFNVDFTRIDGFLWCAFVVRNSKGLFCFAHSSRLSGIDEHTTWIEALLVAMKHAFATDAKRAIFELSSLEHLPRYPSHATVLSLPPRDDLVARMEVLLDWS